MHELALELWIQNRAGEHLWRCLSCTNVKEDWAQLGPAGPSWGRASLPITFART